MVALTSETKLDNLLTEVTLDAQLIDSYVDFDEVTEVYQITDAERQQLETTLSFSLANSKVQNRAGGVYTSVNYGSFKKSSLANVISILTMKFVPLSAVAALASVFFSESSYDTIYYTYIQSSWSDHNGFHVRVTVKFYRDAGRRSYITETTFNRTYVND